MKHWLPSLLLIVFSFNASAHDLNSAYTQGADFSQGQVSKAVSAATSTNPADIPGFKTANPSETQYQQADIKSIGTQEINKNEGGQFVQKNFMERPMIIIDRKNDPTLKESTQVTQDAKAIITGQSERCKKAQAGCKTTYRQQACNEPVHAEKKQCTKDLIVQLTQPPYQEKIITVNFSGHETNNALWAINITTAQLHPASRNITDPHVSVTPPIGTEISCSGFEAVFLGSEAYLKIKNIPKPIPLALQLLEIPNCANGYVVKFSIKDDVFSWLFKSPVSGQLKFHIKYQTKPMMTEYWQNNCAAYEQKAQDKICYPQGRESCSTGKQTRDISGMLITRDCWQKQLNFICGQAPSDNNCGGLRAQGCEQINSSCQTLLSNGLCAVHLQTFQCANKICPPDMKEACGGEAPFCLEGNCAKGDYQPSPDFNKAIAGLSGAAAASKDFDTRTIFRGNRKDCRKDFVDFSNCCADSGWGHDIGLASCSEGEKELGRAKEAKLCHEIGSYCSDEVLGFCVEHSKSYCCFNSKLARIIQEQGRGQLGIYWGDAEHPNCRGLTPEELQRVDFSRIDFSEFYADIQSKQHLPDIAKTQQRIADEIKHFYDRGPS